MLIKEVWDLQLINLNKLKNKNKNPKQTRKNRIIKHNI